MKKNEPKKLSLGRVTIQHLDTELNLEELNAAKGGTAVIPLNYTLVPVYC